MAFTEEEFDIMVDELLCREPVSFDMLCYIADKTLRKKVNSWCAAEECLRGRGYEDDIMQEIQLRLIKTTINYFLLREGINGPINNDPKGFKSWMITVAENLKRDFSSKVRNIDFNTENTDSQTAEKIAITEDDDNIDQKREELKQAFSIVLSADIKVYKVLTWIAQFLFIMDCDITKIQSNEKIIESFQERTLFEMYDMILALSKKITWIEISSSQNEKIINALNKPWNKSLVYGDVRYKEFFMKVNGEKSGKKSISDWVNRMNNMLRRKMKKDFNIKQQIARRDIDESSNN